MTANGNLKWQKNFEELRLAVDRLQLQSSKGWTSPGGYCKLFENGEVSIRWYSNSKTLTVKGEKANEIKEKLLNFDRKLSGVKSKYIRRVQRLQIFWSQQTEICIRGHETVA